MNAPFRGSIPSSVLIVHNRYQIHGGEEAVVEREAAALAQTGMRVETLIIDNEAIRTPIDRLRTAIQAAHAPRGIAAVLRAVETFRPQVVHVHNTFPLISPAVHAHLRRSGAATVQTLHNYRLMCANALLQRDGSPCEDCVTGSAYRAVRHACYRGSRIGTLAVAHMIEHHRRRGTWTHDVDRFIALTDFARSRFIAAGVPADRIRVKPNGLADPGKRPDRPRRGPLFVGRLSAEKGIRVLADAARASGQVVTVIGDGPLAEALKGTPGLVFVGRQHPDRVAVAMADASALIVPSLWYEGLPMVIAEAFAAGTPVIASRLGALASLVDHGRTGRLVEAGNSRALADALVWAQANPDELRRMGEAARCVFEREWEESVTTTTLVSIYAEAMASRVAQEA